MFFGESGCRGLGEGGASAFSTSLMTAFSTGGARTPPKCSYATVVPSGAVIGASFKAALFF